MAPNSSLSLEARRTADALRAELYKVTHRRMTYILLAVLGALIIAFYVFLWLRIDEGPGTRSWRIREYFALRNSISFLNAVPYGLALERFFATIICVVFAGTMMGNEYDWRTGAVVVSRGVRRWQFLFAKAIVSIAFTVAAVTFGLLVAMVCSAVVTSVYDLSWGSFGLDRWWEFAASVARTSFVMAPFVLLALLAGTVLRSAGQAVGASLGLYFFESIFTSLLINAEGWMSHVPDALLNVNGDYIMRANGIVSSAGLSQFLIGSGDGPLWRASLVVLAWMAAFVIFVFWRFQRRDLLD